MLPMLIRLRNVRPPPPPPLWAIAPDYEAKNIYASNYGVWLIKWSYFKYLKHFPLCYITTECYEKERLTL